MLAAGGRFTHADCGPTYNTGDAAGGMSDRAMEKPTPRWKDGHSMAEIDPDSRPVAGTTGVAILLRASRQGTPRRVRPVASVDSRTRTVTSSPTFTASSPSPRASDSWEMWMFFLAGQDLHEGADRDDRVTSRKHLALIHRG